MEAGYLIEYSRPGKSWENRKVELCTRRQAVAFLEDRAFAVWSLERIGDREKYKREHPDVPVSEISANVRQAGRPPVYSDREKDRIVKMREKGMTIRAIAREMNCSVGYVQKLINEHTGEA